LNVVTLELPPLRARGDDVLLLVRHFVEKYAAQSGKKPPRLSDASLEALRSYHWPGNIRELENLIQRLVVMVDDETVDVADLPSLMHERIASGDHVQRSLAQVEAEHIRAVLAHVEGNKTRAAEILGIDRKTLRQKLKSHGLGGPA
jgi:DNA-binding NtrC family response regulator